MEMEKETGFLLGKKGQGLSVNAIILIILGVVVLAVLVLGFTIGWNKLLPFVSKSNNVNDIVSACDTSCATHSQYDFCTSKRDLKAEAEELKDVTCYYLSVEQTKYGINKCAAVTCSNVVLLGDEVKGKIADQTALATYSYACGDTVTVNKAVVNTSGRTVYTLSADGKTLLSRLCPIAP